MPLDEKLGRLLAGTLGQFARPEVTVPTLPEGFTVDEVRQLLALVLADAFVFQDYLAATYAGFGELPVAVHDKWFSIDEPDVPVEVILQQGPAGLDATGLARLAMSGPTLEHWDHVLSHSERFADHGPGSWFFDPLTGGWAVEPHKTQPSQTVRQPSADSRTPPWWRGRTIFGIVVCCATLAVIGGFVIFAIHRTGERVLQELDQFESDSAQGKFTAAVTHLRDAHAAATNSMWPVPGSAKSRLDNTTKSPRLLGQLLRATDLTESEAALRDAVSLPLLDQDPDYHYALGLTLRRADKLADASTEFEKVLSRLGEKPQQEEAGVAPAPNQSDDVPSQLTRSVFGTAVEFGKKVRLTHAMNLLELGDFKQARAWLTPMADGSDDRPFGPKFLLWVASRAEIPDATLRDIVAGRLQANTASELRDHAYSCLYRKHFTRAAELFERLFGRPDFAKLPAIEGAEWDVSFYHAAAAAIRAGRLGDLDAPGADVASKLHAAARKWATRDKESWLNRFQTPQGISPTYFWFITVRQDAWLGVTRDYPRREEIAPVERGDWKRFWEELDVRFQGLQPLKPDQRDWDIPI